MNQSEKTQAYFDLFAQSKEQVFHLKNLLTQLVNWFLADPSNEKLAQINSVFQNNEKSILFETESDMWRAKYLFEIMAIESEKGYPLYASDCDNFEKLLQKLLLTIFSMRRIELHLDEDFTQKGKEWLIGSNLSPIALLYICNQELFVQRERIYQEIKNIYRENCQKRELEAFEQLLSII